MQDTFLDEVARKIVEENDGLAGVCVVFPNRRAAIFFQESLKKNLNNISFLPQCFSMEDFVSQQGELQVADSLTLLFEMYPVHKEVFNDNSRNSIEELLRYGQMLLSDFNELDSYLLDHSIIFRQLKGYGELQVWDVEDKTISEYQKRYMDFFSHLAEYYQQYTKRLEAQRIGYQGLVFRSFLERQAQYMATMTWDKVYFVGFNALTPVEQQIIYGFKLAERGEVFWDADAYIIEDKYHEAGHYMRKNMRVFKDEFPRSNCFKDKKKQIDIYAAPGNISQVKMAGKILSQLDSKSPLSRVAVVLADESLLEPFLFSLPENITEINITMGVPLETTSLYGLLRMYFKLFVEVEESVSPLQEQAEIQVKGIYYKDLLELFSHPIMIKLFSFCSKLEKDYNPSFWVKKIIQSKRTNFFAEDITSFLQEGEIDVEKSPFLWDFWGVDADKVLMLSMHLLSTIEQMIANEGGVDPRRVLLQESTFRLFKVFRQLSLLYQQYRNELSVKSLFLLFKNLVAKEAMRFSGEPLSGIQVMGMLETRVLDFDTVLILSVNESSLPGKGDVNSFIPFEMRQEFQLPLKFDRAAIYAYHFYRLLHRASHVHLIYSNQVEGMGGGEESRFLKQLRFELPAYNPNIEIRDHQVETAFEQEVDQEIVVEKSPLLYELLLKKAESGFSATTMNTYRQCSLKFYLQEILRLQEPIFAEDVIDQRTLGTIVHKVLQDVYGMFDVGETISPELLAQGKLKINAYLEAEFKNNKDVRSYDSGRNHLLYRVAFIWLNDFLKRDMIFASHCRKKSMSYGYIASEKPLQFQKNILTHHPSLTVKFKGFVDRIDSVGDEIRIIDYKTGRVTPNDLKMKSLEMISEEVKKKEIFQLLFYKWLFVNNKSCNEERIQSGIFSFPELSEGFMQLADNLQDMEYFEQYVRELLDELFDVSTPFSQVENAELCNYCRFQVMCGREI